MQNQDYIKDWVKIRNNRVFHCGSLLFENKEADLNKFLKCVYSELNLDYPKFHKMDGLSKLGILASEILFTSNSFSEETALIFSNKSSSLEADRQFQASTESFASPALFVYTLPNIVLGEISIKFNLKGENAFFVSEKFDTELITDYTSALLKEEKAPQAVCGWLNLQNDEYDVFLCLISSRGKTLFSEENLEHLYYFE